MNFKEIPIFIISYNRLTDLKNCVIRLEQDGYRNINIIDNNSSEDALLDYLKTCSHKVYFMDKNYGHMVFWQCGLFDEIIENQYYVVTDPDIIPDDKAPDDYVEQFYKILQNNNDIRKVGFGLKIDDLPDSYEYKYDIIRYESFYWENRINWEFPIYKAPIDTTFALYMPNKLIKNIDFYAAIRTGYPYIASHLGWYISNKDICHNNKYMTSENISSTSHDNSAIIKFSEETINRIMLFKKLKLNNVCRVLINSKSVKQIGLIELLLSIGIMIIKFFYWKTKNIMDKSRRDVW